MSPRRKFLQTLLSVAAFQFRPKAAGEYPSRQVISKLTLAAVKFESDEECREPFGKLNPNEYGVLPVMLVLQNEGEQTLLLNRMEVYYQVGGARIEPTPPTDLPFLKGYKKPKLGPTYPVPIPLPKKKNPMSSVDLDARAFTAKTLPKGESANGFFYFQTRHRRNAVIYVSGIREGVTNKELFFAELPLDSPNP
jgi:hypothetical protein